MDSAPFTQAYYPMTPGARQAVGSERSESDPARANLISHIGKSTIKHQPRTFITSITRSTTIYRFSDGSQNEKGRAKISAAMAVIPSPLNKYESTIEARKPAQNCYLSRRVRCVFLDNRPVNRASHIVLIDAGHVYVMCMSCVHL